MDLCDMAHQCFHYFYEFIRLIYFDYTWQQHHMLSCISALSTLLLPITTPSNIFSCTVLNPKDSSRASSIPEDSYLRNHSEMRWFVTKREDEEARRQADKERRRWKNEAVHQKHERERLEQAVALREAQKESYAVGHQKGYARGQQSGYEQGYGNGGNYGYAQGRYDE